MPRDNLAGSSSRCLAAREGRLPRCTLTSRRSSSDDKSSCLENPRPEGAEPTLTDKTASPFQAESAQNLGQGFGADLRNHEHVI